MTVGVPTRQEREKPHGHRLALISVILIIQSLASVFFFGDAVLDIVLGTQSFDAAYHGFELLVAAALVAGVILGSLLLRRMIEEEKRRDAVIALAQGALAELVEARFAEWKLTGAESEVALFALKGCDIAEIARLRDAAQGTVRAQLSRIYDKAGVSGQSMLIGLFMDELLDVLPAEKSEGTQSA